MSDSDDDLEALRLAALRSKKTHQPPPVVPSLLYPPPVAAAPPALHQHPLGPPPAFVYTQPPPLVGGVLPWPAPVQMAPPVLAPAPQRLPYGPIRRGVSSVQPWRHGRGHRAGPYHRPSPPSRQPRSEQQQQPIPGTALTYIVPVGSAESDATNGRGALRHNSREQPHVRKESSKFSRFERHSDSEEEEEEFDVTSTDVTRSNARKKSVDGVEPNPDLEPVSSPVDAAQEPSAQQEPVKAESEQASAPEVTDPEPAGEAHTALDVSASDSVKTTEETVVSSPEHSTEESDDVEDADVINMALDDDDDFDKMLAEFEDFVENPTEDKKQTKGSETGKELKKKKKRERKNSCRATVSRQNSARSGKDRTDGEKSKLLTKASEKRPHRDLPEKKPGSTSQVSVRRPSPRSPLRGDPVTLRPERSQVDLSRRFSPFPVPRESRSSPGDRRHSPSYLSPRRTPPPRSPVYLPLRRSPSPPPPPPRPLPLTQEEFIRRMQQGLPLRGGGPLAYRRSRSRSPRRRSPTPPAPGRRIRTPSLSPSPPRRLSPRRLGGARSPGGRFSRSPPRRRSDSPSRRPMAIRRSNSPTNRRAMRTKRSDSPENRRPIGIRRSASPANRRPVTRRRSISPTNSRPIGVRRSISPARRRPLAARRGRGPSWQPRPRVAQRLEQSDQSRDVTRDARDLIRTNRDTRDGRRDATLADSDAGVADTARENPKEVSSDGRDGGSPTEQVAERRPRAEEGLGSPTQEARSGSPDREQRGLKRRRWEKRTAEKRMDEAKKQEELQRLPSAERERVLRRLQKFNSSSPVVGRTQTIRLRAANVAEESGSLSPAAPLRTSSPPASPQKQQRQHPETSAPQPPPEAPPACADEGRRPARERRRLKPPRRGDGRRVVVVAEEHTPVQTAEEPTDTWSTSSVFSRLGGNSEGAAVKLSSVAAQRGDASVSRRKLKLKRSLKDGSSGAGGETERREPDLPDPLEGHIRAVRARNAALIKRSREVEHDKKLYG